jgi:hypothetical protein
MQRTNKKDGSPKANMPQPLFTFTPTSDMSLTGFNTVTVNCVLNRKQNICRLKIDTGDGIVHKITTFADEEAIYVAICNLLNWTEWRSAHTARHQLVNHSPDILTRDSVAKIIAHTLKDARPEDNAPTVEEFMTIRYTEA